MKNRGSPARQAVFSPPFSLVEAHDLTAPKPLSSMAVLEAVYLFCLLPVCAGGRYVNWIFRAVRKLPQWVANGTRFVQGGCSGSHWQSMFRLPAGGDFFLGEAA
jgi:hypothetical protein